MELLIGIKGAYYIFWREIKRFLNQKLRIMMLVVQPAIWLVLMGNMMTRLTDNPYTAQMLGVDNYLSFMTPGVMIMSTLYTGVFGGISIIWDRRMGFLIKLLSAPIPRYSIALGKMSALILQAMFQVLMIALLAAAIGVKFVTGVPGVLLALLICGIFAGIMSAISLILSASIRTPETLFSIINFLTLPLVFTSSALFPTAAMPAWIQNIAHFNPISYAVTPVRTLVLVGWEWGSIMTGSIILLAMLVVVFSLAVFRFEKGTLL
jgi:ABC-2 type transport system permease protein